MESDDDFDVFSPPQDSSPPSPSPKLKRLKKKKSARVSRSPDPLLNSVGKDLPSQVSDSLRSSNALLSEDPTDEPRRSLSGSVGFDGERKMKSGFDDSNFGDDPLEREIDLGMEEESVEMDVLDERQENSSREMEEHQTDLQIKKSGFDNLNFHDDWLERERDPGEEKKGRDEMDGLDGPIEDSDERRENSAGETEKTPSDSKSKTSTKKRCSSEESTEKKEKKKRAKGGVDNGKPKMSASEKRKAEKERVAYLDQLHSESQRLLRETRDAQFKPAPIVQKPISSILEKIRQRKLEVSKRAVSVNSCYSYAADGVGSSEDIVSNFPSQRVQNTENMDDEPAKEEPVPHPVESEGRLNVANVDGSIKSLSQSTHETSPSHKKQSVDKGSNCAFRSPVDDTQDLFGDSQTSDKSNDLPLDDELGSPLEEEFAPSLLTMKLKFDSAPVDDDSPDEENDGKENLDPHSHGLLNECSSPKGVPVKAFLDDEAEEEDDSDNDLSRFKEEDEYVDDEDTEEFNDLIATTYEEKPVDTEKRNELHQKWLEQQDAAGTDNLLWRLNCNSKLRDTILLDQEEEIDIDEEEDNDDEEFDDPTPDDAVPVNAARANLKKVKQMIPQMFTDKDDEFVSSDDEENERNLLKQRILAKRVEEATIQSPAEDESSRGIFSLIKKLNVVPDPKKKAKASSFFNMQLSGGKSNNSSKKSSFLHRATNHSVQSSKHKSVAVKSFIFGRDDSNSRSTISTAEDSSDLNHSEYQPIKVASVKFSSSQSRSSSQKAKLAVETASSTSLFEILKGSSVQSNHCARDNMLGQTQTVFAALKSVKKSIKIEGRS
ncbi:hypothetical protein RJ641_028975 [Dillenia turbinata]|uniref:DNA replication checkpoint mediator MRC1 domain-containing protein n=1 Tax=Dillenia turbinata TaxID=194707 RepID=A0AAN8VST2_9MAGN